MWEKQTQLRTNLANLNNAITVGLVRAVVALLLLYQVSWATPQPAGLIRLLEQRLSKD